MIGRGEIEDSRSGVVNDPAPLAAAPAGELVGMLEVEQAFGLAVAGLLVKIASRRAAAVVPDHRAGCERDPVALVLEPPAKIDVVAGSSKLRVEPVDRFQDLAAKRHVAARDVLGRLVVDEHVRRLAGRRRHAGARSQPPAGRHVRPADGRRPGAFELIDQEASASPGRRSSRYRCTRRSASG